MRAAKMDPQKELFMCRDRREFRPTTMGDIAKSLSDKKRGQGPRVGPFQAEIPGEHWEALPKYDFTTQQRSSAFNERMHVEWENHVDHILANGGELPLASVVAKAGFRSCAPCCRDMLALARPTGKTFIMLDLAEQDDRGTFHFACGEKYLPVPKEHLDAQQLAALKRLVADAQSGVFASSEAIAAAVEGLGVPLDAQAQALYLSDGALLPPGSAGGIRGEALLGVLHAEHFARLAAEYGASILRDAGQPEAARRAVLACRDRAARLLLAAWAPHLPCSDAQLREYAVSACRPLLPDDAEAYDSLRRSGRVPRPPPLFPVAAPAAERRPLLWRSKRERSACHLPEAAKPMPILDDDDDDLSTAVPDDNASSIPDDEAWDYVR